MEARERVDPVHGRRGKQRSTHNTYFTLPVLFAMLSNHYGQLYGHRWNWVILVLVICVLLTAIMLAYQRLTGPTYPKSVLATVGGATVSGKLVRTHAGAGGATASWAMTSCRASPSKG